MLLKPEILNQIPIETLDQFKSYHRSHPWIWKEFYALACEMAATGRKRYGAKSIMEVLRWNYEKANPNKDFKINNNFAAYYARLCIAHDPKFETFFELRTIRGLRGL